uniref:Uncharacterized protein n=1 Tax=Timema tahoe TaxID=61484 RepID=A0A7R9NUT8_9NEOP|nr:unnamed protein product [Timema tahoe]
MSILEELSAEGGKNQSHRRHMIINQAWDHANHGVLWGPSNLVKVGLNPSGNQVRCRRETRDWSGPKPTRLEQGLASCLPAGWAGSKRVSDDELSHRQHTKPQLWKSYHQKKVYQRNYKRKARYSSVGHDMCSNIRTRERQSTRNNEILSVPIYKEGNVKYESIKPAKRVRMVLLECEEASAPNIKWTVSRCEYSNCLHAASVDRWSSSPDLISLQRRSYCTLRFGGFVTTLNERKIDNKKQMVLYETGLTQKREREEGRERERKRVENHFGKTTLSTLDRDSNLDFPVIGSIVYYENSALDTAAIEKGIHVFIPSRENTPRLKGNADSVPDSHFEGGAGCKDSVPDSHLKLSLIARIVCLTLPCDSHFEEDEESPGDTSLPRKSSSGAYYWAPDPDQGLVLELLSCCGLPGIPYASRTFWSKRRDG